MFTYCTILRWGTSLYLQSGLVSNSNLRLLLPQPAAVRALICSTYLVSGFSPFRVTFVPLHLRMVQLVSCSCFRKQGKQKKNKMKERNVNITQILIQTAHLNKSEVVQPQSEQTVLPEGYLYSWWRLNRVILGNFPGTKKVYP